MLFKIIFCSLHFDNSIIVSLLNILTSAIIGACGVLATHIYNKKKQKIEDDNMFKSLFESFNKRYDNKLNDLLNELKSDNEKVIELQHNDLIIDYLNLCAEEYLWYKKGRITADVWDAWKAGIVENLNIPQVKDIYLKETKTPNQRKSFYGLCEDLKIT
jgi:hypothetical protein